MLIPRITPPPNESLSSSLHLFHSNFSRLPSVPQHLQCSTELSGATARMPLESNSTISLSYLPVQTPQTIASCQSHWIPAKIALFMSTVRFISEKSPWLYVFCMFCICDAMAPGLCYRWFSCLYSHWCVKKKVMWMLSECYTNINHLL